MLFRVVASAAGLLAIVLLASCSHQGDGAESEAAVCADGLDNDGDGQTDCADSDCTRFAFCAGSDASKPRDGQVQPRDQRLSDTTTRQDQGGDGPMPATSYGTRCDGFAHYLSKCTDGKSICVPATAPSGGFCTYSCQNNSTCPAGPKGEPTSCNYSVVDNGSGVTTKYCQFNCSPGTCPSALTCTNHSTGYYCE